MGYFSSRISQKTRIFVVELIISKAPTGAVSN